MLELLGITHRYGDNEILSDISLDLKPGERLALMGPSGCGKTTLLRIALGLLQPTEGSVRNTFRKTGMVFQEPRLLPWRTAVDNVNLVLGDRRNTVPQAMALLQDMELEAAAQKYPGELSGGMQQRLALARALAMEPELLVLDEPFKGLDEELRRRILQQVNKTGAAVILVTHDGEEARALDCRIVDLMPFSI